MKTKNLLASVIVLGLLTGSASATLYVYEPFDYTPNAILTGQGGAQGTVGVWNTADVGIGENGGKTNDWFVHAEGSLSGVGLSGANPSAEPLGMHQWDGTVSNLVTSGGYTGLWGADDWADPDGPNTGEPGRNLSGDIALDPSVTASFQTGTTTWISYVAVRGWDRNEEAPNLVLGTGPAPDGSRGDNYGGVGGGDTGFGTGGGPTQTNRVHFYPMHYNAGQYTNVIGEIPNNAYFGGGSQGADNAFWSVPESDRMDWVEVDPTTDLFGAVNIVVMKIEWNADTNGEDILSVARFLETDTISEANFDALITAQPNLSTENWLFNKPNIDETQLDTLTFMGLKNFVDEIRVADSFSEALPAPTSTSILGDTNDDGVVDTLDIDPFVLLLTDPAGYATAFPGVDPLAVGDINMDTVVDTLDIDPFVALLTSGSLASGGGSVPEPSTLVLLASVALLGMRKLRN